MPDYRLYKLNAQGHVTGPALVLICERDADIIQKVEYLVDGDDVEIVEALVSLLDCNLDALTRPTGGGRRCPTTARTRPDGRGPYAGSRGRARHGVRVR
jgi:hypothetical protein